MCVMRVTKPGNVLREYQNQEIKATPLNVFLCHYYLFQVMTWGHMKSPSPKPSNFLFYLSLGALQPWKILPPISFLPHCTEMFQA